MTGDDLRGLASTRELLGGQFSQGIVFHTGRHGAIPLGDRLVSIPVAALWETA